MNLNRKTGSYIAFATLAMGVVWSGGCKGTDNGTATTTTTNASTATLPGRELPTKDGNKQEGDTIKIGLIASLNGEQQPWGQESQRGAEMAVDEFNAAGGKDGLKVQLIVEDTGSKPEGGKSATEKLIGNSRVLAVVGEVASGITLPAAQVAQEAGVPLMAIGATRVNVTQQGGAIFRACFTDAFQGPAIAKFAYEDLKLRRVAIMTDQKLPYSTGLSETFKAAFTKYGGEIVDEQKYESGTTDFKGQLTNIKAKNPDGLFCSGYFNEVGPIANQRLDVGLNVPMFGGDGWDSATIMQAAPGIYDTYYLNHYHNSEKRPEVQSFIAAYKKRFGGKLPANAMSPLAYDATGIVLNAIKNAPTIDSKAILKAISETKDYKGVTGNITIGPDGNAEKPALMLKITKAGIIAYKQIPFFKFEG